MRIYLLLAAAVGASFIGSNCGGSGVGDPCVPEDEYLTTFAGFSKGEVNVESRSFQCETRVCLVNHFQGRVSCPYGQKEDGDLPKDSGRAACGANVVLDESAAGGRYYSCAGPDGVACPDFTARPLDPACQDDGGSKCATAECQPGGEAHRDACRVPDRDGSLVEDRIQVPVDAQLSGRQAFDSVYCSCRCDGPDDNARYCECPSGFICEELVDDLGLGKGQLAGSYCVKDGTSYDETTTARTTCGKDSGELCGPACDDCEEYDDETRECIKERDPDDDRCYAVDVIENGVAVRTPRNWGGTCEGSGVVCQDDTNCCTAGSIDPIRGNASDNGSEPCSSVGVEVGLSDGTSVRVCP